MSESLPGPTILPEPAAGLRVLVVGLGRFGGGVGVTRWLVGQGAEVTVTDRAGRETLAQSIDALGDLDVTFRFGEHDPGELDSKDLVVVNPALRKAHSELFQAVARRGIPWTTELNLFCQRCPATVIGVTGTYGKSTTCAMLADALDACRRAGAVNFTGVHLGGNIGRSLLTELKGIRTSDVVVLEMSSAQLEDLPRIDWAPCIAVITNLRPHHLDRYGTYAAYLAAKLNIIAAPEPAGKIIVGSIDAEAESALQDAVAGGCSRIVRVTRPDPPVELSVPGEHNRDNAACVLAVCCELSLDESVVRAALREFAGLPHRLELVRSLDGVDYYNDSKSTSPAATQRAIEALDRPIVAIVGGQNKDAQLGTCAEALAARCRAVICTSESGSAFARDVRASGGAKGHSVVQETTGLADAVRVARAHAERGGVVLFSPGAPSFDGYLNFADRGRHFIDLVNALP